MTLQIEKPQPVTDPAFLAAKIRALKAQILAGAELAKLAFLESPLVLYQKVLGTTREMTPSEAQRAVITRHVEDLLSVLKFTGGGRRALFEWLARRYQVENLKVIMRAWARKMPLEQIEKDLVPMPEEHSLPVRDMLGAQDVGVLASFVPEERFAGALVMVMHRYIQHGQAFFLEAAIEKAYYVEALSRARALFGANRAACLPMIQREVLCYDIVFTLRCVQTYQLPADTFSDLVVPHGPFDGKSYVSNFAKNPVETLLDAIPHFEPINPEGLPIRSVADIEDTCARYLYRAARKRFAASIFDFGAVVAYYYLKRFELQDILRLGEAIRLRLSAEETRGRLITAGEENA